MIRIERDYDWTPAHDEAFQRGVTVQRPNDVWIGTPGVYTCELVSCDRVSSPAGNVGAEFVFADRQTGHKAAFVVWLKSGRDPVETEQFARDARKTFEAFGWGVDDLLAVKHRFTRPNDDILHQLLVELPDGTPPPGEPAAVVVDCLEIFEARLSPVAQTH